MVLQTAKVSIISETGKFLPDFLQKRAQRGDSPLGSTFTHKLFRAFMVPPCSSTSRAHSKKCRLPV